PSEANAATCEASSSTMEVSTEVVRRPVFVFGEPAWATWASSTGLNALEYASQARESRCRHDLCVAVTSGPLQQGTDPGLIAQRGAPRGRARQAAVRGPELTATRIGRGPIRVNADADPRKYRRPRLAPECLGRSHGRARSRGG